MSPRPMVLTPKSYSSARVTLHCKGEILQVDLSDYTDPGTAERFLQLRAGEERARLGQEEGTPLQGTQLLRTSPRPAPRPRSYTLGAEFCQEL